MIDISARLAEIRRQMRQLVLENETQAHPPTLIAVSKKQPLAKLKAAIAAGQRDFGESYLQEALDRRQALADDEPEVDQHGQSAGESSASAAPLVWHFIGPVQANKCRDIARYFDWVHSIDRSKIAKRLSAQRELSGLPPLQVLLQVNIDADENKSGLAANNFAALCDLAAEVQQLPCLELRGLMTILQQAGSETSQQQSFAALRHLLVELQAALPELKQLDQLSMGMSGDWQAALAEGATMVRIGTAIFGERS